MLSRLTVSITLAALTFSSANTVAKNGRVEAELGDLKLRLAGRLHYDMLVDSSTEARNQRQEDWRRARLSLLAKWKKDWRFGVTLDFPDGEADVRNIRLDYRGWPVYFSVGRLQEPFGLATSTSSNYLPLMERSIATVIGPKYGTGIKANYKFKSWQATLGLFGSSLSGFEFEEEDEANGDMIALRSSWKAIHNRQYLWHLGASFSRHRLDSDTELRLSKRPESILIRRLNISHPTFDYIDTQDSLGFELALRNRSRLIQAEYLQTRINLIDDDPQDFYAYYVEASWALTGERRRYSSRFGVFGGIKPKKPVTKGGMGAWEIAVRYSYLNLQKQYEVDDIDGEIGEVFAAGINWYLNNQARVMLNALYITEDDGFDVRKESVIQARIQYRF